MAKFAMKEKINASADAIWKVIREFKNVEQYLPLVKESKTEGIGVGTTRICTMQDGAIVTERLLELNEENRTLRYQIIDPSPFPISNYIATMVVRGTSENESELDWSCVFEPKGVSEQEAKRLAEHVYKSGFKGLKNLLLR